MWMNYNHGYYFQRNVKIRILHGKIFLPLRSDSIVEALECLYEFIPRSHL